MFLQIPLGALQSTPAVGRVVIGALLNAAYEADGRVKGRILYLLDEAARLGPMKILETARDAGRKYGITLQLLYQSVGQLERQWGRDGKRENGMMACRTVPTLLCKTSTQLRSWKRPSGTTPS